MVFRTKPPQCYTCYAIFICKTHGIKIGCCIAKLNFMVRATSIFIGIFTIIRIIIKINDCVHFISRCKGFLIGDGNTDFAICPIITITSDAQNNFLFRNIRCVLIKHFFNPPLITYRTRRTCRPMLIVSH